MDVVEVLLLGDGGDLDGPEAALAAGGHHHLQMVDKRVGRLLFDHGTSRIGHDEIGVAAPVLAPGSEAELLRLEAGKGTRADVEKIARIHNGGPRGHKKKATDKYWEKVSRRL